MGSKPDCTTGLTISRRQFLRVTAASAATLTAAERVAHAEADKPKGPEKVLIFGHVPQEYLKRWQITSDLAVAARKLGVQVEVVDKEKLRARHAGLSDAERAKAAELSRQLIAGARQGKRSRPDDAEVEEAARFYLAMRAMVAEHKAAAVTIACGDFRTKTLRVPCASLTLLADDGIPAGCQVDIDAVLTMVLYKRAGACVGFMAGARVADDRLMVTHCVLSRKMSGPSSRQPYYLAAYHRDTSGVTIHTDLPAGKPVTVARLTRNLERLLVAEGEILTSLDEPRACRNMLIIKMPGARRLMTQVPGGQYHLVVACGHHLAKLRELATKAGIDVFTA